MKYKDIEIKYSLGHTKNSTWVNEDIFCTNCGKKGDVWSECGEGDYYHGNVYMCLNCGAEAHEPVMSVSTDDLSIQTLKKLRKSEIRR